MTQSLIASMRSVEKTKVGFYVSLIALGIKIALNYILIFGKFGAPRLEAMGAGVSTLVARVLEFSIVFVYVFFIDKELQLSLKKLFCFDKTLFIDFFKHGAPIILAQLVWSVNMLASSAIMGRQKTDGVLAALSIANTLNNFAYVVLNGLSGALGIITGKTVGSGNEKKIREYAKTAQVIFLALGVLTGVGIQFAKMPFISLYSITPAARAFAKKFINILTVTAVGTCYHTATLLGLVKSGGDTSFVLKVDSFFVFLVVIPSSLIATRLALSPTIIFAALKSDHVLKCFVAAVKVNKFNWAKNLTKSAQPS